MVLIHIVKDRYTLIEQRPLIVDKQALILCHCLLKFWAYITVYSVTTYSYIQECIATCSNAI